MASDANEMTHDDIWDDSALVNSWNQALEEYQKYHSIHASGVKLEDSDLSEFRRDAKPETNGYEPVVLAEPSDEALARDDSHAHETTTAGVDEGAATEDRTAPMSRHDATTGRQFSSGGVMPPPQMLLGSVQDEGLKKLLMSWYYAGYYTGLYESQQKQQPQQ